MSVLISRPVSVRASLPDRRWHTLTLSSAAFYGVVAMLVPGYRWGLRAILVPCTVVLVCGGLTAAAHGSTAARRRQRLWDFLAAQVLFGLPVVFSFMWLRKVGLPFILSGRESFLTFLTAHNTRDFPSLIIQDLAIGEEKIAHPFFYLNHPNLPSRVVSLVAQTVGLDLQAQLLLALCISTLGFLAAFLAFRAYFSSVFAFVVVAFLSTSYGTLLPKAFDLLWSINILLFWLLVHALFRDRRIDRPGTMATVAVLSLLVSLSDWGLLVFVAALITFWIAYHAPRAFGSKVVFTVVIPTAVGLAGYAVAIARAVGSDVLATNLAVNVYGRLGQIDSTFLQHIHVIDMTSSMDWLRDHNITVLPRPVMVVTFPAFLVAYWRSFGHWLNVLKLPLVLAGLVTVAQLVVGVVRDRRLAASIAAASTILVVLDVVPPLFLLVAIVAFLWCLLRRAEERPSDSRSAAHSPVTVWITLVFTALVTAFAVFPSYTAFNTLNAAGLNLPAGLVESALLAGAVTFLVRQLRYQFRDGRRRRPETADADVGAAGRPPHQVRRIAFALGCAGAIGLAASSFVPPDAANIKRTLVLISTPGALALFAVFRPRLAAHLARVFRRGLTHESLPGLAVVVALSAMLVVHVGATYRFYSGNRPGPYPFMPVLAAEQFRGRSFVTNNDDAAVWYFTRGWAYSISSALPVPGVRAPQKYFADWKNEDKYSHPEFYLCDYSRFTPPVNKVDNPEGGKFETCRDVAAYLATAYGYRVIVAHPEYAVVSLR